MIGGLLQPTIRVLPPTLQSNAPWIPKTPTTAHRPMDIPGIRDTQKARSNHSANRSRNISRNRSAPSASHTGNHSDSTHELHHLASLHSANQCLLAFLDHLDPV